MSLVQRFHGKSDIWALGVGFLKELMECGVNWASGMGNHCANCGPLFVLFPEYLRQVIIAGEIWCSVLHVFDFRELMNIMYAFFRLSFI